MHDPWNPSPADIRQSAYDAEAVEPCQDFELALAWTPHEKVLLECGADAACPKRDTILAVLAKTASHFLDPAVQ